MEKNVINESGNFSGAPWKSDMDPWFENHWCNQSGQVSCGVIGLVKYNKMLTLNRVKLPLDADAESVLSLSPLILDSQGSQSPTQHYRKLLSRSTKINEAHQDEHDCSLAICQCRTLPCVQLLHGTIMLCLVLDYLSSVAVV